MDLWFTEKQTSDLALSFRVKETLHREKSKFQEILVVDTYQYGRLLALDGVVMTTVADEFVYHEMITHVPLFTHPSPQEVAVVGGGDGGSIREILRHPEVKRATLVEIDERVVEVSRQYLPELSSGLSDPRVDIRIEDGIKHMAEVENRYDCVIVDSTDPVGPAVGLFREDFYRSIYRALKEDGIFAAQTESLFLHQDLLLEIVQAIRKVFPIVRVYWAAVPTYPSTAWSFTIGSKKYDPLAVDFARFGGKVPFPTKYYTPEIHKAAFVLPAYAAKLLSEG